MNTQQGFWHSLDALCSPAAVLVEWQALMGAEFDRAAAFLRPTQEQAETYPCARNPRCSCRHDVVALEDGRIIAPCRCDHEDDCPTLSLTPADVVIHELDLSRFGNALLTALGLEPGAPGQFPGAIRSHRIGTKGAGQTPAVLCLANTEPALLAEVGGLCAANPDPFILLTPTGTGVTPRVGAAVRRHGAIHIPLSRLLALDPVPRPPGRERVAGDQVRGDGAQSRHAEARLKFIQPIEPLLARLGRPIGSPPGSKSEVQRSALELESPRPTYALRKGGDYWTITFDGQDAPKKHEKGMLYVAWLLMNPPAEPIHAIDLVGKIPALYRRQLGITSAVDETTGKQVAFAATAMPQERSHAPDDLKVAQRIREEEAEWEGVLDDDSATEPEKAEAIRKLDQLAEFRRKHAMRSRGNAERLVRAVRLALTRLHANLAKATDTNGQPHPVLRAFADHLARHLIAPSARYNGRMNASTRAGVAGRFTYEPPEDVAWCE